MIESGESEQIWQKAIRDQGRGQARGAAVCARGSLCTHALTRAHARLLRCNAGAGHGG